MSGWNLPEEMTPEMERVWRAAFIAQTHKRRGRGPVGNARRQAHTDSAERVAWRALRKHLLSSPTPEEQHSLVEREGE